MNAELESGMTGNGAQNERNVQMNFELNPKLKKEFEHTVLDEGKSMSEVLRGFIKKYVSDHHKPVVY